MIKRTWLLLLVFCLPLAACGDNGGGDENNDTPPETTNNYTIEGGSLADPRTATVARVDTIESGWVVVFEGTTLLGHAAVDSGETTDIEVEFDVTLGSGSHTLDAVLYADDGAEELFEVPGSDRPILENGELVATTFDVEIDAEFEPTVDARDQTLASAEAGAVTISSATARDDAWIVVRSGSCTQDLEDAGEIRGVRAISRGETTDVVVDLSPEISNTETLCAYIHDDDPKDGEFTYEDDIEEDRAINIEGTLVADEFAAGLPTVDASDQSVSGSSPNAVTVDRVASPGAGWIAVRRGACSADAEIVGHETVEDGENTDVVVSFDEGEWILGPTETFCATLHTDDPDDDSFTYPTDDEDLPVPDGEGDPVEQELTVTVNAPQTPSLEVSDQRLSDTQVAIDTLYVPAGRWLALYTDDGAGARDTLVGHAEISPTPQQDIVVAIDTALLGRQIVDGETLHVAVHTDDPNDEVFDPQDDDDPVVLDDSDAEFSTSFVAYVPTLSVSDQTADPATELTIDRVRAFGAGWIAAYDGACPVSGDSWGPILGFVAVDDGESTDVTLTVDSALADQQTVCIALHNDDPADDTFENTDPESSPDAVEARPQGDPVRSEITVSLP